MSEIIDIDWIDPGYYTCSVPHTIGVLLTYDKHDGFKVRIGVATGLDEELDQQHVASYGTKQPFRIAEAWWGDRMLSEWARRHVGENPKPSLKYDGEEIKNETV